MTDGNEGTTEPPLSAGYSKLIVYVDESGDHGPASRHFPVFVLAFCIFNKKTYANQVTSLMHRLKFKHFGHDTVVLHEREMRKSLGPFRFLMNPERRSEFLDDVTCLIENAPFTLVATVIDKRKLAQRYSEPENPYHLAIKLGLERVERHRDEVGDTGQLHCVFESRGKKEDDDLELAFRRVCDHNVLRRRLDYEIVFAHKQANHCGHQLADLVARPIGLHVLNPAQRNRAYDALVPKFRTSPSGAIDGWGLKCFP